jgi:hypothetical protein
MGQLIVFFFKENEWSKNKKIGLRSELDNRKFGSKWDMGYGDTKINIFANGQPVVLGKPSNRIIHRSIWYVSGQIQQRFLLLCMGVGWVAGNLPGPAGLWRRAASLAPHPCRGAAGCCLISRPTCASLTYVPSLAASWLTCYPGQSSKQTSTPLSLWGLLLLCIICDQFDDICDNLTYISLMFAIHKNNL